MKKSAPEEPLDILPREVVIGEWYIPTADEKVLMADVLVMVVESSGQRHFTVNAESRLGQAIAKRNPALYPSKGQVTVHESILKDTIAKCVAESSIDRMKNLFAEDEANES